MEYIGSELPSCSESQELQEIETDRSRSLKKHFQGIEAFLKKLIDKEFFKNPFLWDVVMAFFPKSSPSCCVEKTKDSVDDSKPKCAGGWGVELRLEALMMT